MTKNLVQIIGFAGQDPKRFGNIDSNGVRFSVATTERWRDKDGNKQERTEWHTVVFWNRLADIAADLVHKGSHIFVSGPIRSRSFEDKGATRTVWEIHARELLLLDPKSKAIDDEADESLPPPQPSQP